MDLKVPPPRERILNSALQHFADVGYDQATMGEIAVGACISVNSVYNYYRGKQAILDAAMDIVEDTLCNALPSPEAIREMIHRRKPVERILEKCVALTFPRKGLTGSGAARILCSELLRSSNRSFRARKIMRFGIDQYAELILMLEEAGLTPNPIPGAAEMLYERILLRLAHNQSLPVSLWEGLYVG